MKIIIEVTGKIADELLGIAKNVGFKNREELLTNYVREVILAARSDAAAQQAKREVLSQSSDLDPLIPDHRRPPTIEP